MIHAICLALFGVVLAMAGVVVPGVGLFMVGTLLIAVMQTPQTHTRTIIEERVVIHEVQVPVTTQYTEANEGRLEFPDGSALQTRSVKRWNYTNLNSQA